MTDSKNSKKLLNHGVFKIQMRHHKHFDPIWLYIKETKGRSSEQTTFTIINKTASPEETNF